MIIAIDGPVASGKSAIGRMLAQQLGYRFVDTGAMYRALTWLTLDRGIDLADEGALVDLVLQADIQLDSQRVVIDGHDVIPMLRLPEVEKGVSLVARVLGVRQVLVARQRQMAQGGAMVMAGRDIGTVVLPDAELKLYLAASVEERARRRYLESMPDGEEASYQHVLAELERRDRIDSERALAHQPASDARIIETDGLGIDQVLARIMGLTEGC